MNNRGSILFRFLAAILIVGMLILGAALIFSAGRATGYSLGLSTAGSEALFQTPGDQIAPGYQFYGPAFAPFPFMLLLALLCFGGMFFAFLFAMGGIFRHRRWRKHGMRDKHKYWAEWYARHGEEPPWEREHRHEEPPAEEGVQGDEPDDAISKA